MSNKKYMPNAGERRVAASLDGIIEELLNGALLGIGVCGVRADGAPVYFYYDKTPEERRTLHGVMNRMMGLYEQRTTFAGNAPANNRSYGTH